MKKYIFLALLVPSFTIASNHENSILSNTDEIGKGGKGGYSLFGQNGNDGKHGNYIIIQKDTSNNSGKIKLSDNPSPFNCYRKHNLSTCLKKSKDKFLFSGGKNGNAGGKAGNNDSNNKENTLEE